MDEDVLRLLPDGAAIVEQLAARLLSVGTTHIDQASLEQLRRRTGWATAREFAAASGLAIESATRSLVRLMDAGLVEANDDRPRAYRAVALPVEVPWGFKVRIEAGRPWVLRLETDRFAPDGTRVVVFVWSADRAGDAGSAFLRSGRRAEVEAGARETGLQVGADGELLLEPITMDGLVRLADASAKFDVGE